MGSVALEQLLSGLEEVEALQKANPSPIEGSGLLKPAVTRALGRAEVVLLSSHFEHYIYGLTEEAAAFLSSSPVASDEIPVALKLNHSKEVVDSIYATSWEKRSAALTAYSCNENWMWTPGASVGSIDHERVLRWMKSPSPKSLVRAFRIWGIDDIFSSITRKPTKRTQLRLKLGELVEKRNNIAHGDFAVEATYLDIVQYKGSVRKFCISADKAMARALSKIVGAPPW